MRRSILDSSCFYYPFIRSSRFCAPFQDVFLILVVLSLGVVLRLSDITPGESEARVVGRNTRQKRDNKKIFKNHIISSIITSKDFLSVKKHRFLKNKKLLKNKLLWTSRSVGGTKRIRIRNRNLQTKITVFLCASYVSTCL